MSFDGLFAYNAGNILPSTLKWYIASVLEIVSLWHKLFISPPPLPTSLLYSRWLCTMPTVSWNTVFLEHVLYFVCQPVGTMSWPWASLIFLDNRCNFLLRCSSQSNSDSGSSTSPFLGATLDLCSVLGQNGFSSGTARLLPLCNSNRMINQFLSASLWIWMILVSIFFPPSIYLPYSFCPF